MKKFFKWVAIIVLIPILLFLLLAFLLYLPPVQNWVVDKVATYASEQTGMDISVGHVSLKFPLDLAIDDFKMIKDNDSIPGVRDTIADVGQLVVDVQLRPLFKKQVEIDAMKMSKVRLNTNGFIPDLRVKGNIEKFSLECHGIDLNNSTVNLNTALLDSARLDVCLGDTMPPDTTETKLKWKIHVQDLRLARTDVTLHMPGDTLQLNAYLADAQASNGNFDLENKDYRLGQLQLRNGRLAYDNNFVKPVGGLDTNHILLSETNFTVDNLRFCSPEIGLTVKDCSFKEKSGISVEHFSGEISMDSLRLSLPSVSMRTPDSNITAKVEMDMNAFDDTHPGKIYADVDGYLGKQDLVRFMRDMPQDFVRKWPNHPLTMRGKVTGNMRRMDFNGLYVSLPTAFNFNATGYAENFTEPSALKADVKLKGTTGNLDFITTMLPREVTSEVKIPQGIGVDGRFKANGSMYGADFVATEGGGKVKANVAIDTKIMKYSATIDADKFPIQHFLPKMGLSPVSAYIEADGQGTDPFSRATSLRAKARIKQLRYEGYNLDGMSADASLHNGRLSADIDSHHPLFDGKVRFDALMSTNKLQGTFSCDLNKADLYQLRFADMPLTISGCAHVDIDSDLKNMYKVKGSLAGMSIYYKDAYYTPDDLDIDLLTRPDTTYAYIDSGDFRLDMNGSGGYQKLLKQVQRLGDEFSQQLKNKHFDQVKLRDRLPDVNLYLNTGNNNFFANILQEQGFSFESMHVNMNSSHVYGLNGDINVNSFAKDSMLIDTLRFTILTDSAGFKYNGQVRNGPDNPMYTFNALFDGNILEHGAEINAKVFDKDDVLGIDVGAVAAIESEGVRVTLTNQHPIIGYVKFNANEDNYVYLGDDKRLSANLKLKSDEGTSLQLYTNDENLDALQDFTVSVHQLDLGRLMATLPFLPNVTGMAEGDFHVVQTPSDITVSSALNIASMTYENLPMGNIGSEFVYMPNEDGSHYVDGTIISEGEEIATLIGTYYPDGNGRLDAEMELIRLPLSLANGFMPDQMIGLRGFANGQLTVKGPLSKPDINGDVLFDDAYVYSLPYGFDFKAIAEKPLRIVGSNLLFDDFKLRAHNDSCMTINGNVDFSDLDQMKVSLRMRANNFMVINAKENLKSEAYGKAFIDLMTSISGPVDKLSMRGRVNVLGSTDMTYVLRDSPLTTDNRLDELVKFVDFNDSTVQVVRRPAPSGFDMNLTVNVDEGAHIKCDLNADHSNYIDLVGGGNLRLQYSAVEDLKLTGRYTISSGEMKYSLPVIPLKTFNIEEGSYLEFKGDPMNPVLHITALEQRKAAVEDESGGTRTVDFNCGVILTQTLNDMGLEFTIQAPEDVTIGSELASMTKEERGKVAVTMLTTGMYLADGNTSGFSMNGALSSFLQSEINNITGNALRTLDLSVGVDNATDASGAMHTDYSFKFAKRFWNNRLRIVVGGKVSTGSEAANQNQSFFTDVTFEYRLSPTSNKYLKLFYNRDAYDWLEGDIGEYGGGFLWRRKLQHFKDIFKWKNEETMMPLRPQRDSTRKDSTATDSIIKPQQP